MPLNQITDSGGKGQHPVRVLVTDTVTGEVLEDCVSTGGVLCIVRDLKMDGRGTCRGYRASHGPQTERNSRGLQAAKC